MKFTSKLKKHFALGLGAAVLAASIAFLNPAQTHAATVTVKAGDTVSALASTYKSTIAQIERENNIASNHMIYVGQSLSINGTTNSASQVTVKAGDTVSGLAAQYGTTVSNIETLNNIVGHMIYVGQVLNISKSATTTTAAPARTTTSTTSTATTTTTPARTTTTNTSSSAVAKTTTPARTTTSSSTTTATTNVSGSEASAKAIIASRESGGSYTARNGQYIGKYQLTSSYLNGDYSAANQEKVANSYVASRYGSWTKALAFWNANGWY
ncbi:aggregation promoting factor [Lapidilactobacillus dextrinicus DSM 20335]|uniref:Aggregation promoting factor n=1 Tax=Lapidilactobacillus dextrinicus DSM 20335 TaxID=1423738 RepID=A0A0R2BI04_9LACO|nr:LysM peptidoglycan-binding domain-containing protein [Lapidilactobacillus dextrinicus]KRM78945.1 aggregation promoting factor [Lapidilactobacillus dextrinicus DSM 20335]